MRGSLIITDDVNKSVLIIADNAQFRDMIEKCVCEVPQSRGAARPSMEVLEPSGARAHRIYGTTKKTKSPGNRVYDGCVC